MTPPGHRRTPGPDRGDEVVEAVLTASRALVALAARSLAEAGEEVTLTQYRSLVVLAGRGPQHVTELAEAVAVGAPTASRMCDRLVRKGLVTRRTDRGDRRQVTIALTTSGRALVDAVTERRRTEIRELVADIPTADQRALVDALRHLAEAAHEPPDAQWRAEWAI